MIRVLESKYIQIDGANSVNYREYAGLHDDAKPTEGVATGSTFIEVDTGDVFFFDEASAEWKKVGGD